MSTTTIILLAIGVLYVFITSSWLKKMGDEVGLNGKAGPITVEILYILISMALPLFLVTTLTDGIVGLFTRKAK